MSYHHHPVPAGPLTPAISAPPGQISDLVNHENHLWRFNIVTQTACLGVAGILFLLRCYVRLGFSRMPKQWILEDCTFSSILVPFLRVCKLALTSCDRDGRSLIRM